MGAYLIIGPSATGKTSLGWELSKRGYHTIDTDEAFGYYGNLETKAPVEFPGNTVTDEWYQQNGWLWQPDKLEQALSQAEKETTFFCGGALNEQEYYHRFSKIFLLYVAAETLKERLLKRVGDPHTNNPAFISRMLAYAAVTEDIAKKYGMVIINTTTTINESADQILSYVHEH